MIQIIWKQKCETRLGRAVGNIGDPTVLQLHMLSALFHPLCFNAEPNLPQVDRISLCLT